LISFPLFETGLKRTGKSCRLRWLNYLKPDVRRGNLTPQEQLLILELHSKLGNRYIYLVRLILELHYKYISFIWILIPLMTVGGQKLHNTCQEEQTMRSRTIGEPGFRNKPDI